MFLDDVTLAEANQNANSKGAYDGKYFYAYSSGKALAHLRPVDHPQSALMRAGKANFSKPPITINPLYYLFGFALPDDDKSFAAFSKPATWDNLKDRIVDFKSNSDGSYLFRFQERPQSDENQATYTVTVISKNGVFVPLSVKEMQSPQNVMNEIKVLEYSEVGKSTFPMPVPLTLSVQAIDKGTPSDPTVTVVDKESLQINSPVDKRIFTLHPKDPTELVDVEILE